MIFVAFHGNPGHGLTYGEDTMNDISVNPIPPADPAFERLLAGL